VTPELERHRNEPHVGTFAAGEETLPRDGDIATVAN
jgi:hypothetical protein